MRNNCHATLYQSQVCIQEGWQAVWLTAACQPHCTTTRKGTVMLPADKVLKSRLLVPLLQPLWTCFLGPISAGKQ